MKWKCYIDTNYNGLIVKANVTEVEADASTFASNSYWYPVEEQDAVKTPVKPRIPKIPKVRK